MLNLEEYDDIICSPLKELTLSQLFNFICWKKDHSISLDESFNIFVKNKKKQNNILVVAHLDRVLEKEPRLFRYEDHPKRLYGAYGWDDRAGIIAALELFKEYDVDLLFTTGEEQGCVGAKQVNPNKIRQYNLIFELDRHGNSDFINDCALGVLCNDDFTKTICDHINSLGFKLEAESGVYTDIGALREKNKTAQMFYMSCGYYNEHTESEYLIPDELNSAIDKAKKIIEYVNEHPEVLKPFVPVIKEATKPIQNTSTTTTTYRFPDYYSPEEERFYCYKCDEFMSERDLISDKCPYCGGEVFDDWA